jgi:HSP20 family protein
MPRRKVEDWYWRVGVDYHRLAEELSGGRPKLAPHRCWEPMVDVFEDDEHVYLKAELAGVRGEDIQLVYLSQQHSLLIRGIRQEEDVSSSRRTGTHVLEIAYGEFERDVRLPDVTINPNRIRATLKSGFLLVIIPKEESPTRTITVSQT